MMLLDGQPGEVTKLYRWFCSCGQIHESIEEPEKPLKCPSCGGINGHLGDSKNYSKMSEEADSII